MLTTNSRGPGESLKAVVRPSKVSGAGSVRIWTRENSAFDAFAQVDECRLHARQHPRDLATVDVANHSSIAFALDKKLSEGTFFDDRYAGLGSLSVDHEHVLHLT